MGAPNEKPPTGFAGTSETFGGGAEKGALEGMGEEVTAGAAGAPKLNDGFDSIFGSVTLTTGGLALNREGGGATGVGGTATGGSEGATIAGAFQGSITKMSAMFDEKERSTHLDGFPNKLALVIKEIQLNLLLFHLFLDFDSFLNFSSQSNASLTPPHSLSSRLRFVSDTRARLGTINAGLDDRRR